LILPDNGSRASFQNNVFFNQTGDKENIQYMCWFMLEILANLEVPSSYKCLKYGIAETACSRSVFLIVLENIMFVRNVNFVNTFLANFEL
jgi:hypothetical protein